MVDVKVNPKIDKSWETLLSDEFNSDYFKQLKLFLQKEKSKYIIYPPGSHIFSAFNYTPFDKVKVVIIGQDPYHGPGQANGLCFSVNDGVMLPPSLRNIYKEIKNDLGVFPPTHGNLENWAKQGVLLLNATLTVRARQAASHQKKGWEIFTDRIIEKLSKEKEGLVFLLWGNYAQAKAELIDESKHFILKAAHPSPLSASRGFFGCKHFSKTNQILKKQGKDEIRWADF